MQLNYHRLKIISIKQETNLAKTFILEPLDDWDPEYLAGQFITLVFLRSGDEQRRSYSISSSPEAGEPLSITVKKIDNGEFSRKLVYDSKLGDILYSSGIGGFFTLKPDLSVDSLFFFAAGSGITPCYSLIKSELNSGNKNIILVYSNKNRADTIFLRELESLEQNFNDRLKIIWLFSDLFDVERSRLSSYLLNKLLDKFHFKNIHRVIFYLCGPYAYMQMAEISLRTRGTNPDLIFREQFDPLPRKIIPRPPDLSAHKVIVSIANEKFELTVQYPQSIIKAAKAQGYILPYSCEAGICGNCVATCLSGTIWMAYNEVLMDDEIKKGKVLTCQGFPVYGDAEIIF